MGAYHVGAAAAFLHGDGRKCVVEAQGILKVADGGEDVGLGELHDDVGLGFIESLEADCAEIFG